MRDCTNGSPFCVHLCAVMLFFVRKNDTSINNERSAIIAGIKKSINFAVANAGVPAYKSINSNWLKLKR